MLELTERLSTGGPQNSQPGGQRYKFAGKNERMPESRIRRLFVCFLRTPKLMIQPCKGSFVVAALFPVARKGNLGQLPNRNSRFLQARDPAQR